MIKFKTIRSKVSKIFSENQQMKIVVFISSVFWKYRKYFLAVEIDYPKEFIENWKKTKKDSSLEKERSFSLYQLIKIHNEKFKEQETNIIEFGVSKGSSLMLISKVSKNKTNIFGVDSFGVYSEEVKKFSTSQHDNHYQGAEVAFNK